MLENDIDEINILKKYKILQNVFSQYKKRMQVNYLNYTPCELSRYNIHHFDGQQALKKVCNKRNACFQILKWIFTYFIVAVKLWLSVKKCVDINWHSYMKTLLVVSNNYNLYAASCEWRDSYTHQKNLKQKLLKQHI